MCGIAGELRFDGIAPVREAIERMSMRLARRGPDGTGYWQNGPVAFAHRRLAIIDLSERSHQPMVDAASATRLTESRSPISKRRHSAGERKEEIIIPAGGSAASRPT